MHATGLLRSESDTGNIVDENPYASKSPSRCRTTPYSDFWVLRCCGSGFVYVSVELFDMSIVEHLNWIRVWCALRACVFKTALGVSASFLRRVGANQNESVADYAWHLKTGRTPGEWYKRNYAVLLLVICTGVILSYHPVVYERRCDTSTNIYVASLDSCLSI